MGAMTYETYGYGRDVGEALDSAIKEAQYMSGHGGYSGTLAEKVGAGAVHFGWCKTAKSAQRIAGAALNTVMEYNYDFETGRESEHVDRDPALPERLVEKALAIQDKWGPTGVLQVGDDSRAGERIGYGDDHTCACGRHFASRQGLGQHRRKCEYRTFLFFGWASS